MRRQLTAQTAVKDKQQRVPQVVHAFGIAVRFTTQSGQVAAQSVIHAFDGVRVRFAFEVLLCTEDVVVALVFIGGVSD